MRFSRPRNPNPDPVRSRIGRRARARERERTRRVEKWLAQRGYRIMRASSSGQRRGAKLPEILVPGDRLALPLRGTGLPILLVEVGSKSKSWKDLYALRQFEFEDPVVPLLAKHYGGTKWVWYLDDDESFDDLDDMLEHLRDYHSTRPRRAKRAA
jgi:hypothetical protein